MTMTPEIYLTGQLILGVSLVVMALIMRERE